MIRAEISQGSQLPRDGMAGYTVPDEVAQVKPHKQSMGGLLLLS